MAMTMYPRIYGVLARFAKNIKAATTGTCPWWLCCGCCCLSEPIVTHSPQSMSSTPPTTSTTLSSLYFPNQEVHMYETFKTAQDRMLGIQQDMEIELQKLKSQHDALKVEHQHVCEQYTKLMNAQCDFQQQHESISRENRTLATHIDALREKLSIVVDTVALLQHRIDDDYEDACVIVTRPRSSAPVHIVDINE